MLCLSLRNKYLNLNEKPTVMKNIILGVFFFDPKVLIFFLFLHKNICYGNSLEVPHRDASNEYHNICFRGEIRKIFTGYPPLSRPLWYTHTQNRFFEFEQDN